MCSTVDYIGLIEQVLHTNSKAININLFWIPIWLCKNVHFSKSQIVMIYRIMCTYVVHKLVVLYNHLLKSASFEERINLKRKHNTTTQVKRLLTYWMFSSISRESRWPSIYIISTSRDRTEGAKARCPL